MIEPPRKYLAAALRKKQQEAYVSIGDRLPTEMYITSETVFDFLIACLTLQHVHVMHGVSTGR